MTTDKELLELAAKAIDDTPVWGTLDPHNPLMRKYGLRWNPLADDGDALRLAVELRIDLEFFSDVINCIHADWDVTENYGNDPYAATRRAIVRAAAEIGGKMK